MSRHQILAVLGASSLAALPASADALPEVVVHKDRAAGAGGLRRRSGRAGHPGRVTWHGRRHTGDLQVILLGEQGRRVAGYFGNLEL